MKPVGKTSTSWEKRCQLKNASPGETSPVGRNVFAATTRAKRSGCSPTSRNPMSPPQSWQTSVIRGQIQTVEEKGAHPFHVTRVGVVATLGWFVRSTESDQIRSHDLQAGSGEHGNHRAVQIRPGGLAVEQQDDRRVRRAFAHIVDPQGTPFPIPHLCVARGRSQNREVQRSIRRGCATCSSGREPRRRVRRWSLRGTGLPTIGVGGAPLLALPV